MGVSTLHASNMKGFAFEFACAHPVWIGTNDTGASRFVLVSSKSYGNLSRVNLHDKSEICLIWRIFASSFFFKLGLSGRHMYSHIDHVAHVMHRYLDADKRPAFSIHLVFSIERVSGRKVYMIHICSKGVKSLVSVSPRKLSIYDMGLCYFLILMYQGRIRAYLWGYRVSGFDGNQPHGFLGVFLCV